MYAIIYIRRLIRVPAKDAVFAGRQFLAHFSSRKSSSAVSGGDATFTISYLTDSIGMSLNDATSVSKKLCIISRENSDAVLDLFIKHGFTNAQISRIVTRWPAVLRSCADKTLSPKLEFFRSIGGSSAVLLQKLSQYPHLLTRSFGNYFIPWYDYLKRIVRSDKNVATVFLRSPKAFTFGWPKKIPSNVTTLRERRVPESSIASLIVSTPSMMILKPEKFSACVDRAAEMGFDESKAVFILALALRMFGKMSESTLRHKMDVYRRCGWFESDLTDAFLKYPCCMIISQKKIIANMDFLVNESGIKPGDVAQNPTLLSYSHDRRLRPRWTVVRIIKERGLMKESMSINTLFQMAESKFLKRFITDHEEEFPELMDIYRGKISPSEIGLNESLISK